MATSGTKWAVKWAVTNRLLRRDLVVLVRSFIEPDFWQLCAVRQYQSDLCDQFAMKIRVRIRVRLRVALFSHSGGE